MNARAPLHLPPRIVLCGVGNYGKQFTRLAKLKGWEIVGAYDRNEALIGQDLGRASGLEGDIGVVIEDIGCADPSGLGADVGVVFVTDYLETNLPIYEMLFRAGLNVICHGVQSYYPWRYDPDTAAKIDGLAKAAGKTFTGTGIWDMSRIWSGIVLAGPCAAIRSLHHHTVTDINFPGEGLADKLGLDLLPDEFSARYVRTPGGVRDYGLAGKYQSIPEQVLTALGFEVTAGKEVHEPVTSNKPVFCKSLGRDIAPGRTIGWRYRSNIDTAESVTAEASMEMRLLADDEIETMVWEIDGLPRNRMVIERKDSQEASAATVLNRIPDVIAAQPGIRLLSQLGPMQPQFPLGGLM